MYVMKRKFLEKLNSENARTEFTRVIDKTKGMRTTWIMDGSYNVFVYTNLSYRFKIGRLAERFAKRCIMFLAWCCNICNKEET